MKNNFNRRLITIFLLSTALAFLAAASVFCETKASLDDYYRLKTSDPVKAKKTLESVVAQNPQDVKIRLELAYLLLAEKKTADAVVHLEAAHKLEPDNETTTMQLAYAYQTLRKNSKARSIFVAQSTATETSPACQALSDMATSRWAFLPKPVFAEFYLAPLYLSRFNDTIIFMNARAGLALGPGGQTEVYAGLRHTDDNQSTGGEIPIIFSDNADIYSVGVRHHFRYFLPLSVYAEVGRGYDITYQNRPRWRDDARGGLTLYKDWVPPAKCSSEWRYPWTRSSSLYSDVSYYSRYDDNWIGYLQWREGRRLVEKSRLTLDGLLYLGGAFDSNRDYYNNIAEIGAGFLFKPDFSWPIYFRYTAVRGTYIKVPSPTPPPDSRDYTDHRWEAVAFMRF